MKKWLEPPFFPEDEQKSAQARTINTVQIYFLTALIFSALVLVPLLIGLKVELYAVILALLILNLVSRHLLFRGRMEFACILMISGNWALFVGISALSGGISSPFMIAIVSTTISSGYLINARIGAFFAALSVLAGLILALLEQTGLALPQVFNDSPLTAWCLFGLVMFFVYALMNLTYTDRRASMARENSENDARRLAEQALRQSEERFQMFMLHFPGLAYMKDSSGQILFVNQGFHTYLGLNPSEMIGRTSPEVFGPEFGEKLNRDDQRILELGISQDIQEEFAGRIWMTHKFCINQPGASPLLGGVTLDTTERLQAMEALRESDGRYKSMFEQAPIAINITRATQITYANPAYLGMFGYENLDELERLAPLDLFTPEARPHILENIQRSAQGLLVPNAYESECLRKDGSRFPVHLYLTRAVFSDGPAILAFILDITESKKSQEALREPQSTLNAIIDSTSDLIWSVDPETFGLLTFNQGLYDYFLQKRSIRIQACMRPEDLFPTSEFVDRWRGFYQRALKEGPYTTEYVVFGESTTLLLNFNILRRDDRIFGVSVFGKDITESNRAQAQLQILKHSIDTAPDSAYWMDIQGNFIYANDSACKALGYTRAELLQMNVQGVNPLATAPKWAQVVRDIREKKNYTSQSIHRRKDGSEFSVEINSAYIKYGDQEYINGFARDVTERKLAEETLRESEEKYRGLVENSIQGVIFYQDFGLVYVNSRLCEISGYSAEELVPVLPQRSPDLVHPDDRERVAERTERFLRGEVVNEKDSFRIIRKDGQIRNVETFSKSLTVEGKPAGIVTMLDVTEREQREQELQAIATLSAALRTAPNRVEMLPTIVGQVAALLHSETVSIEIIDPSSGDAVVEAAYGSWKPLIGVRQDKEKGLNSIIRRTLKPYLTQDLESDPNLVYLSYPEWARKDIRATAGMPLITQEKLTGFIWIGRKTEITSTEMRLLSAIADITANAIQRATSHEQTLKAAVELARAYDTTLEGWAHALELRDQETEGHARRVVDMTVSLAQAMGIQGVDLENVRRGALLHDIGKMGIPDSVLLKPGTLNEREWEIMRRHTEYARDLIMPIDYLRKTIDIPYDHHEKWDGTGYPRGLKGEEIPLAARLFAVADVWDALTSDRPYRKAWSKEQALRFVYEQKGRHFDPRVVDLFLEMIEKDPPSAF